MLQTGKLLVRIIQDLHLLRQDALTRTSRQVGRDIGCKSDGGCVRSGKADLVVEIVPADVDLHCAEGRHCPGGCCWVRRVVGGERECGQTALGHRSLAVVVPGVAHFVERVDPGLDGVHVRGSDAVCVDLGRICEGDASAVTELGSGQSGLERNLCCRSNGHSDLWQRGRHAPEERGYRV